LGKGDRIALRKWRSLQWRDPCADLVALGLLQGNLIRQGFDPKHDDLRARELREYLEQKQAALFSYFCSHAILKDRVEYAMFEDEDYDCVLRYVLDHKPAYTRVQLKEVVPPHRNPNATIETELDKFGKYVTSRQTIIAVHVNQEGLIDWSSIEKPKTAAAEIWLYAALTPNQSRWFLYGNLLYRPQAFEISWPTACT
jgi:hypothetical protein